MKRIVLQLVIIGSCAGKIFYNIFMSGYTKMPARNASTLTNIAKI